MNEVTFKDGTKGLQPFDRLVHFDEKSRNYPILTSDASPRKPISKKWKCEKHLDQGTEGACVGAGLTHALLSEPLFHRGLDMRYARNRIYWMAQYLDPWEGGSYPDAEPFYEGTAVLTGLQVIKKMGWIKSYKWAFNVDQIVEGIGYEGPAVFGIPVYEGMMTPDSKGFIKPSGKQLGGHCLIATGINIKQGFIIFHNSWGNDWGVGGDCFMTLDHLELLMESEGECAFLIRH